MWENKAHCQDLVGGLWACYLTPDECSTGHRAKPLHCLSSTTRTISHWGITKRSQDIEMCIDVLLVNLLWSNFLQLYLSLYGTILTVWEIAYMCVCPLNRCLRARAPPTSDLKLYHINTMIKVHFSLPLQEIFLLEGSLKGLKMLKCFHQRLFFWFYNHLWPFCGFYLSLSETMLGVTSLQIRHNSLWDFSFEPLSPWLQIILYCGLMH